LLQDGPGLSRGEGSGELLASRPAAAIESGKRDLEPWEGEAVNWLEFSEEPAQGKGVAEEDSARGGRRADLGGSLETSSFRYGEAVPRTPEEATAREAAEGARRDLSRARLRLVLRALLGLLGITVASFLVLTFLKPRSADEKEGEEEANREEEEHAASIWGEHSGAWDGFDSGDPSDQVYREYLRLQQALERTRNHRRPQQTPMEHGRKASRGDPALEAAFLSLHRVLYRSVYGNVPATAADAEEVARQCRRIRRLLG
jgi:hypothetical protein